MAYLLKLQPKLQSSPERMYEQNISIISVMPWLFYACWLCR